MRIVDWFCRLGAASKEAYHEDTYPNCLHRYLKFDDEMSVISVVWRDCQQLVEVYNEEQVGSLHAYYHTFKHTPSFTYNYAQNKCCLNSPLAAQVGKRGTSVVLW